MVCRLRYRQSVKDSSKGYFQDKRLQTSGQTHFLKDNLLLLLYGHLTVTGQKLQTLMLKDGFTPTVKWNDIISSGFQPSAFRELFFIHAPLISL